MKNLNKKIQEKFNQMVKTGKLFRVGYTGNEIWEMYLLAFPKEKDPVFRDPNSTTHNCNHCNNFIRRYGNIVAINDDYGIETIFDIDLSLNDEYYEAMKSISKLIKSSKVINVFKETYNELKSLLYESCSKSQDTYQLGVAKNVKRYTREEAEKYGVVKPNEIRTFHHFNLQLPRLFIDFSGKSIEKITSDYRRAKQVFKRAMQLENLELVKDLIIQDKKFNDENYIELFEIIIPLKREYDNLPKSKKDNWSWLKSYSFKYTELLDKLIELHYGEINME